MIRFVLNKRGREKLAERLGIDQETLLTIIPHDGIEVGDFQTEEVIHIEISDIDTWQSSRRSKTDEIHP